MAQPLIKANGRIEQRHAGLEELLHQLKVFLHVVQVVFALNDALQQGNIIILLREHILNQHDGFAYLRLIRIQVILVQPLQIRIVGHFRAELFLDVTDQAVFILRHIHLVKEVAQEIPYFPDVLHPGRLPLGDGRPADFRLFAQHIHQLGIIRLDGRAAILDGDLLLLDEHGNHSGNVDFAPAVGLGLIALLHIVHGGVAVHVELHFQKFLHLGGRVKVVLGARRPEFCAVENREDIFIGFRKVGNQAQIAVYMGNQIFQRLIDDAAGFGLLELQVALVGIRLGNRDIAGTDFKGFTIHIESTCCNGLRQESSGSPLIVGGFILLIADNVLHGFGQLADVASLHIFANLHGAFQRFVVGVICQHDDGTSLRLGAQAHLRFLHRIGSRRQDAQHHAAGQHTVGLAIHHLVEGEVITPGAILPGGVDVRKEHLGDAADDVGVGYRGVLDFALDVLFLIGQEVIGIAGTADVVLAEQAVQAVAHLFTHGDLIQPDIVRHQDDDVVQVGLDVIDVTHHIQQLQYVHVLRLDAVAVIGGTLTALNHAADGAVQKGVHGIVEQIEGSQGVFIPVFNLLGCLLEAGEHGALAAGQVLAGIAVLADFRKDLLHQDKLIRHKGEIPGELAGAAEALDVQHRIGEGEQVPQNRIVDIVHLLQLRHDFFLLQKNALLDDFIRRGGG